MTTDRMRKKATPPATPTNKSLWMLWLVIAIVFGLGFAFTQYLWNIDPDVEAALVASISLTLVSGTGMGIFVHELRTTRWIPGVWILGPSSAAVFGFAVGGFSALLFR